MRIKNNLTVASDDCVIDATTSRAWTADFMENFSVVSKESCASSCRDGQIDKALGPQEALQQSPERAGFVFGYLAEVRHFRCRQFQKRSDNGSLAVPVLAVLWFVQNLLVNWCHSLHLGRFLGQRPMLSIWFRVRRAYSASIWRRCSFG